MNDSESVCQLCGDDNSEQICTVQERPQRETDYRIPEEDYQRKIKRCLGCGVYFNVHGMKIPNLYSGFYMTTTYKNQIHERFSRIAALPYERSDNKHRVTRIREKLIEDRVDPKKISLLDVGSGLGVFPAEIKKFVPKISCIDPDPNAVEHLSNEVGIGQVFCGFFEEYQFDAGSGFDLISINKVLEHVPNPISFLGKARDLLNIGGVIYIEVPDARAALESGTPIDREEFFLEHHLIFTRESCEFMAEAVGMNWQYLETIREPSDKHTLVGWLNPS